MPQFTVKIEIATYNYGTIEVNAATPADATQVVNKMINRGAIDKTSKEISWDHPATHSTAEAVGATPDTT